MLLILISYAIACTPAQEFEISCRNYCKFVYDQKGIVYAENKCLCGDDADLNKFVLKLPRTIPDKKEKAKYYYEY